MLGIGQTGLKGQGQRQGEEYSGTEQAEKIVSTMWIAMKHGRSPLRKTMSQSWTPTTAPDLNSFTIGLPKLRLIAFF